MPVSKAKKWEILSLLEEELKKSTAVTFTKGNKLTVENITNIRKDLRKVDAKLILAKKTLIKIAFKNIFKIELKDENLLWQITLLICYKDAIAPVSTMNKYATDFRKEEKIKFVWAYFDGNIINGEEITRIASLPSKEVLLAKLLGSMKAPIASLARFLDAAKIELEKKSLATLKDLLNNEVKIDEIKKENNVTETIEKNTEAKIEEKTEEIVKTTEEIKEEKTETETQEVIEKETETEPTKTKEESEVVNEIETESPKKTTKTKK